MEKEESFEKIFERLDKRFRYDPLTELPDDFEAYFIKLQRRSNQTLQEWSAESASRAATDDDSRRDPPREDPCLVLPEEEWREQGAETAYPHERRR